MAGIRSPDGRRHLWIWFTAGFLLVFIGLAVVYPMQFYDGRAVYITKLWHYYLLEIRHAWNSSGNLGPTSGNAGAALETAAVHIALAVLGGAMAMACGWLLGRHAARR